MSDITDVPTGRDTVTAPTADERLAQLRERKVQKAAKLAEERQAAEIERLELEERFEKELPGTVDRDFAIVDVSDLGEGFVVVKLGPDVVWKTFTSTKMSDTVEIDGLVMPCLVHPSADEYHRLVKRRSFVADRCAKAIAKLYGVKATEDAGK